jgi:hypothetical protein
VDPSLDPELALALRVSLEEERARQAAAQAAGGGEGAPAAGAGEGAAAGAPAAAAAGGAAGAGDMELDEDALLQQALAMSMQVRRSGGSWEETRKGSSKEESSRPAVLSVTEACVSISMLCLQALVGVVHWPASQHSSTARCQCKFCNMDEQ